jgi:3-phosphoshikimate 1-carboxyvinyltransferase
LSSNAVTANAEILLNPHSQPVGFLFLLLRVEFMESLTLQPIARVDGTINLPGSKSVSNRALLLAALAHGKTVLTNLLDSDDVRHMLNALTGLGVSYTLSADRTRCEIIGNGGPLHAEGALELFLGNAGTAMRPLAAALCLGSNDIVLTGEPRMKERPIGHLVDALRLGGAKITYLEQENYPPLRLQGGFTGGNVDVDGSVSSQFLTALLMTAPLAPEDTVIRIKGDLVSKPYIDITLNLMKTFGVEIENQHYQQFVVKGGQSYQPPGTYLVEGDASSASYFLAAAAIKGGTVKVTGIGRNSMQGDIRFADVLEKMGATICWGDDYISCTRGELNAIDMDMNHIPDAAMTIATAALFAKGTTTLRNIYNWRVKETDRLFAMATELRKVGAEVEEGHDYIRITPPEKLNFAEIATYNDHRMAMCFSLVALSDTPVTILDPKCTAKTFPDYFEQLARISQAA